MFRVCGRVLGLGSGFRVWGLGFRGLGFRVKGLGFRGLDFRVSGFRGLDFRVSGFLVSCLRALRLQEVCELKGFRVSVFGALRFSV